MALNASFLFFFFVLGVFLLSCLSAVECVWVYPFRNDPFENPQVERYHTKPAPSTIFGNVTRFAAYRGFAINESGYTVNYVEDLELYTQTLALCDIFWPVYGFLLTPNVQDVLNAVVAANVVIADIWDYVPGDLDSCPNNGEVCELHLSPQIEAMLVQTLGDSFTGMDVGEQDGRYIGSYANQMLNGPTSSREEQYMQFGRHFSRMAGDLQDRVSALTSLYMPHYMLKSGLYTSVGSETAQGLPNAQLFMAFNRGASKQYGQRWWGNVSVYNRFGWKTYPTQPTQGTSLSLMKRLMYSQILYNCAYVSFESGWIYANNSFTPIGTVQYHARAFVNQTQNFGTFLPTVGVVLDFYTGFVPPRHLYSSSVYLNWGNLPYTQSDHFSHVIFDLIYPRYADSSYFHNETGFQSVTPYGDIVDVLLSDATGDILARYPVLILASQISTIAQSGLEVSDKLAAYVGQGGTLVIAAGAVSSLPNGLDGVVASTCSSTITAGANVTLNINGGTENIIEKYSFVMCSVYIPPQINYSVLAQAGSTPLAYEISSGEGKIILFASQYPISSVLAVPAPVESLIDAPLSTPYPLLSHAAIIFDFVLRTNAMVFNFGGSAVSFTTNILSSTQFVVGVFNPLYQEAPMVLSSAVSSIESIEEYVLDQEEKSAVGYLPAGSEDANLGNSTSTTIAGGDTRLFLVTISSASNISMLPHNVPNPRPRGIGLPLMRGPIRDQVLLRPTFFDHYDTVVLDWRYVYEHMTSASVSLDAEFLSLQNVSLVVDFTSGINLYPDLRLIKNAPDEYNSSMAIIEGTFNVCASLGVKTVIVSLHRFPENWYTTQQSLEDFTASISSMSQWAENLGISLLLNMVSNKPPFALSDVVSFLSGVPSSVQLALATGNLISQGITAGDAASLKDRIGAWFVSCPVVDPVSLSSALVPDGPLDACPTNLVSDIQSFLALAPNALLVPSASAYTPDGEYLQIRALESLL